jgi:hypothetical protein
LSLAQRNYRLLLGLILAALLAAAIVFLREPASSPRTERFGFFGGVALGIALRIEGGKPISHGWHIEEPAKQTAHVRLIFNLSGARCEEMSVSAADCISPESAVLRFHISGLLDYRTVVKVEGRRHYMVRRRGAHSEHVLDLSFPKLDAGRHCLLVSVIEKPEDIITMRTPNRGSATVFTLEAGNSETDHCVVMTNTSLPRSSLLSNSPIGCDPVLTISPNRFAFERRGRVRQGTNLWAAIPQCSKRAVTVFARNGTLEGSKSSTPPITFPESAESPGWMVSLPHLPLGGWNLVVTQEDTRSPRAGISNPVLVVP